MKNELKLLLLLIVVIVQAGCVQQKSLPQMKTYYSSNKSFCIDVLQISHSVLMSRLIISHIESLFQIIWLLSLIVRVELLLLKESI